MEEDIALLQLYTKRIFAVLGLVGKGDFTPFPLGVTPSGLCEGSPL